jgi:flagellar basal body rod protein FlgB
MKQTLNITITKIRRQKIMTTIADADYPLRPADDLKFERAMQKRKRRATRRAGIGIFVAVSVTAFGILLWRFW